MITFSSLKGAACKVQTDSVSFEVFPEKPSKDTWTLLSHPEEQLSDKKAVSWPGEYDFSGISMKGIGQKDGGQVSFACYNQNMRIAFVDAPVLDWSDAEIEKMGDMDILVIAADNPKKVTALLEAIDPRVVILFETKDGDLAGVAKACGQASVQPVSEFKAKSGSLPSDSRQVVVLK